MMIHIETSISLLNLSHDTNIIMDTKISMFSYTSNLFHYIIFLKSASIINHNVNREFRGLLFA